MKLIGPILHIGDSIVPTFIENFFDVIIFEWIDEYNGLHQIIRRTSVLKLDYFAKIQKNGSVFSPNNIWKLEQWRFEQLSCDCEAENKWKPVKVIDIRNPMDVARYFPNGPIQAAARDIVWIWTTDDHAALKSEVQ